VGARQFLDPELASAKKLLKSTTAKLEQVKHQQQQLKYKKKKMGGGEDGASSSSSSEAAAVVDADNFDSLVAAATLEFESAQAKLVHLKAVRKEKDENAAEATAVAERAIAECAGGDSGSSSSSKGNKAKTKKTLKTTTADVLERVPFESLHAIHLNEVCWWFLVSMNLFLLTFEICSE